VQTAGMVSGFDAEEVCNGLSKSAFPPLTPAREKGIILNFVLCWKIVSAKVFFYRRDRKARRDIFVFFLCGLRVLGGELMKRRKW
jgi:hypothetical protein